MPQTQVSRRYSIGHAQFDAGKPAAGLYLAATPIGNLGDVTIRTLTVLAGVDTIYCEDTRITARLVSRYGIATPLAPYHDHNAAKLRPRILERLSRGTALALVSDAGTPLVSDPGYKLARAAIEAGHRVEAMPGASAALAALSVSGLPPDKFLFAGFLPQKAGERRRVLEELSRVRASIVLFESPNRIVETLNAVAEVVGARAVSVSRELTKLHEETLRGPAGDVAATLAGREAIKGEITLVIAPPEDRASSAEEIDAALIAMAAGLPAAKAASSVAKSLGIPRREAYERLMRLKASDDA